MKTAEEILSEISGWDIGSIKQKSMQKIHTLSFSTAILAIEEYANQKPDISDEEIEKESFNHSVKSHFKTNRDSFIVGAKWMRDNYHPQANGLLDLDGKTIPVKLKVSKYDPKIDID